MDEAVDDTAYNVMDELVHNVVCNLFQDVHGLVQDLVHDIRRGFVDDVRRNLVHAVTLSMTSDAEEEAGWDQTWLNEIKDVEKNLQVVEGNRLKSNGLLANIRMHLSAHHSASSLAMDEVKLGYYVASLNTNFEARHAELELQKIDLEWMRMEEDIKLIAGEYFDFTDADGET